MRLALIPPISLIDDIFRTDYQLVLPHIVDPRYIEAYHAARKRGDYVMLDNGAAEGEMPNRHNLMACAFGMMVNEIVVPDVLGDIEGTMREVTSFDDFLEEEVGSQRIEFNYMGVVQGQTYDDVRKIIDFYNSCDWITTLGIPRILLETLDAPEARVGVARYIAETYGSRFALHLLGTNPRYIRELERFRDDFKSAGVRGVDTSGPFNYANVGKFIDHFDNISRPGGYFHLDEHHFGAVQLKHNLEVIQEWVR